MIDFREGARKEAVARGGVLNLNCLIVFLYFFVFLAQTHSSREGDVSRMSLTTQVRLHK